MFWELDVTYVLMIETELYPTGLGSKKLIEDMPIIYSLHWNFNHLGSCDNSPIPEYLGWSIINGHRFAPVYYVLLRSEVYMYTPLGTEAFKVISAVYSQ